MGTSSARPERFTLLGAILTLILCGIWFLMDPGFEPLVGIVGSAVILAGSFAFSQRHELGLALVLIGFAVIGVGILLQRQSNSTPFNPGNTPTAVLVETAVAVNTAPTAKLVPTTAPTTEPAPTATIEPLTPTFTSEPSTPTITPILPTTTPTSVTPNATSFNGKIAFISYYNDAYKLVMINTDRSERQPLGAKIQPQTVAVTISTDGSRMALALKNSTNDISDIIIANIDGTNTISVAKDLIDAEEGNPAWSLNNHMLAFQSNCGGSNEIYIVDVDTLPIDNCSSLKRLTSTGNSADPAWSPDGQWIAFACGCNGKQHDIYIVKTDGSGVMKALTNDPADEYDPAWSPDGKRVAFVRKVGEKDEDIWAVDLDKTSVQSNLTKNDALDNSPIWLPDGRIIFVSTRSNNREDIFIMNPDANGLEPFNLTNSEADVERSPSWFYRSDF